MKPEGYLNIDDKHFFWCEACAEYKSIARLGILQNADVTIRIDENEHSGHVSVYWEENDINFLDHCEYYCADCYDELDKSDISDAIAVIDWIG